MTLVTLGLKFVTYRNGSFVFTSRVLHILFHYCVLCSLTGLIYFSEINPVISQRPQLLASMCFDIS